MPCIHFRTSHVCDSVAININFDDHKRSKTRTKQSEKLTKNSIVLAGVSNIFNKKHNI